MIDRERQIRLSLLFVVKEIHQQALQEEIGLEISRQVVFDICY